MPPRTICFNLAFRNTAQVNLKHLKTLKNTAHRNNIAALRLTTLVRKTKFINWIKPHT